MARLAVASSVDFRRIIALPRRAPDFDRYAALAEPMSRVLLNPSGRKTFDRIMRLPPAQKANELQRWVDRDIPLVLQPEQVWPLLEFSQLGRAYLHAPVGVGKTLVSLLTLVIAQEVFGCRKGCLLVKGNGRDQTISDFRKLKTAWQAPKDYTVVTYETLSSPSNAFRLCGCALCTNDPTYEYEGIQIKPDIVVGDESHSLNSPKNVVHKCFARLKKKHPTVKIVLMSGTTTDDAMTDAIPIHWCLGDHAPVPIAWPAREAWRLALNRKLRDESERQDPGVILQLDDEGDLGEAHEPAVQTAADRLRASLHKHDSKSDTRAEAARAKFARRRADTPGFIVITKPSCDKPLEITITSADDDKDLSQAFEQFRKRDETPDGVPIGDPLERFRVGNQLGCGFHTKWLKSPPDWWIEARTEWNLFMREAVKKSERYGRPLYSEGAVMRRYPDCSELRGWREAKREFTPETIARCTSMSYIRHAAALMGSNGPCLVWTPHVWVGETLSRVSGVPYFASQGKTRGGLHIDQHNPKKSAILSTASNRTQRNLQAWSCNINLGAEGSARNNEQQLGRTHRRNQKNTVRVIILAGCGEHLRAVNEAFARARSVQTYTSEQKLLAADVEWNLQNDTEGDGKWRWRQ